MKAALRRLAPKQDLDSQATWSMAQSVLRSSLSWRLGNPNYCCFLILPARQVDSCPPLEGEALRLLPSNTVQTILVHNHLQKDFRLFQKDLRLFQKDFRLFQKDSRLFPNKCVFHRSCCCSTESCSVLSLSPHVYDQELKKTKQSIIFAFT